MHTLAELNPKVGDTVAYLGTAYGAYYQKDWDVTKVGYDYWELSSVVQGSTWIVSEVAKESNWTLKPQPKEKTVIVADLNLKVGDRIQSGDRTGTCTGNNPHYPYITVVWDWDCVPLTYPKPTPVSGNCSPSRNLPLPLWG